jgi:hypothetical protein
MCVNGAGLINAPQLIFVANNVIITKDTYNATTQLSNLVKI